MLLNRRDIHVWEGWVFCYKHHWEIPVTWAEGMAIVSFESLEMWKVKKNRSTVIGDSPGLLSCPQSRQVWKTQAYSDWGQALVTQLYPVTASVVSRVYRTSIHLIPEMLHMEEGTVFWNPWMASHLHWTTCEQRQAQVFGARLAAVDSETPSALAAGQVTSVRARLRYHLCFLLKCQLRGIVVSIFSETHTHTHTLFLWKTVDTPSEVSKTTTW